MKLINIIIISFLMGWFLPSYLLAGNVIYFDSEGKKISKEEYLEAIKKHKETPKDKPKSHSKQKRISPIKKSVSVADYKPAVACKFLIEIGLINPGWENYVDDLYGCTSPRKFLDSGSPLENSLAYYVAGDIKTVKEMSLILDVNNRPEAKKAHYELLTATQVLVKKSFNESLPTGIHDSILKGGNMSSKIGGSTIEVVRDDWPTGKGYSIKVIIK